MNRLKFLALVMTYEKCRIFTSVTFKECSVTDRTYTFKEGKELCLRVSKLIDELGLKRGDVIV